MLLERTVKPLKFGVWVGVWVGVGGGPHVWDRKLLKLSVLQSKDMQNPLCCCVYGCRVTKAVAWSVNVLLVLSFLMNAAAIPFRIGIVFINTSLSVLETKTIMYVYCTMDERNIFMAVDSTKSVLFLLLFTGIIFYLHCIDDSN